MPLSDPAPPADPDEPVDVVVVGSLNLDLVARTERFPHPGETVSGSDFAEHPGGKGLNQAVAAARLGARVALVGAVGDDAAGEHLRELVRSEGIDDRHLVTRAAQPTGRALITVDEQGENTIVVVAGANGTLTVDHLPPCRLLLTQLEVPLATVASALDLARAQGAITLVNPAPAQPLPVELLAGVDVLIPNEHELDLLGGVAALGGAGELVVTMGARGAEHHRGSDPVHHQAPFGVEVLDTTGAGDAFCGALAARLADGDEIDQAIRWAAAAGALATTVAGAVPGQPHRAAVEAMVKGAGG